jgi:hypothetical protein
MGRSAYSGRNWEGFSPDPYLSGVTMEKSVRGLQDASVQATAKHWLLNEREILRDPTSWPNGTLRYEALSSNVDDRAVRKYSPLTILVPLDLGAHLIGNRSSKRLLSAGPLRDPWDLYGRVGLFVSAWWMICVQRPPRLDLKTEQALTQH